MPEITTLLGLEMPNAGELHSRAQYKRNLQRIEENAVAVDGESGKRHYVEYVTAQFTPDGAGQVLPALSVNGSINTNNDFISVSTTDGQLKVLKDCILAISIIAIPTSSAGPINLQILRSVTRIGNFVGGDYVGWECSGSLTRRFSANDQIQFKVFETTPKATTINIAVAWVSD